MGKDSTLRWRFRKRSLLFFEDPEGAKTAIQELLGAAVLAWGDSAPIKFAYGEDNWDFEIGVRWTSDCTICTRLFGCCACKPLEQEA